MEGKDKCGVRRWRENRKYDMKKRGGNEIKRIKGMRNFEVKEKDLLRSAARTM